MTSKEINDLKREHNRLQEEGREVYAKLVDLHAKCPGTAGSHQGSRGKRLRRNPAAVW